MGAEMSLANSGRALTELGAVLEAAKISPSSRSAFRLWRMT